MQDRRMFARFDVNVPTEYRMAGMDQHSVAQCRDISATGIGFLVNTRITPKTILDIVLTFPDAKKFNSLARVIWTKQVYENQWRVGLEFTKIDLMGLRRIFDFAPSAI